MSADDTGALAEDCTACGVALIAPNLGLAGGTARVTVYCDLAAGHDGLHHAEIDFTGDGRAKVAQSSRLAARVEQARAECLVPCDDDCDAECHAGHEATALRARWNDREQARAGEGAVREAKADAWAEGHLHGCDNSERICRELHLVVNPYRAALTEGDPT